VGKLEGKVAFITGAARGQGRSHAVRLAEEGADIIAVDICGDIETIAYPLATPEDLDETVALVEKAGGRIVARRADVRDYDALAAAFEAGLAEFGHADIVLANAGIMGLNADETDRFGAWRDSIDVMLTGTWHTLQVTVPHLIESGRGGAIVITGSSAVYKSNSNGSGGADGYGAAKSGVLGLMRGYANYLAPHNIRVNAVHPCGVMTPMIMNDVLPTFMERNPLIATTMANALPVMAIEPEDVSNAILYLVSDDGRYVTGISLPVDAGLSNI
jgi:SDR family mycofactocin-dependent oxidoreductase